LRTVDDGLFTLLAAALQTYHVYVTTGDKWGAGTDANVYLVLFGENDDTGKMHTPLQDFYWQQLRTVEFFSPTLYATLLRIISCHALWKWKTCG